MAEWLQILIAIVLVIAAIGVAVWIWRRSRQLDWEEGQRLEANLEHEQDNAANWGQMNKEASEKVSEVVHNASKRYLDIK